MTIMHDPYAVQLRVHLDTGISEVVTMTGRNRLHCVAQAANRWPGRVITSADLEPPRDHDFQPGKDDVVSCVSCGLFEWHAMPDSVCSGEYGVSDDALW